MVGGASSGYLGGVHYWWPKMTGRMYPEGPPSCPRSFCSSDST
jgi:heme/copper-type cytochrome/quinol oxidase subunit 1